MTPPTRPPVRKPLTAAAARPSPVVRRILAGADGRVTVAQFNSAL